MSLITAPVKLAGLAIRGLDFLSPLVDLGVRLWVANVFWKSGMTKLTSWDSTLNLFTNVYEVPVLSPELAATLSTAVELGGAVLLAVGLAGRFSAAALFILNIVAVISYPDLSEVGLKDHYYWGLLLLIVLLHGPGKLSVDHWLRGRLMGAGMP
ncbi:MAG: DoxX family protein [Gammaproteobacteria bacterium]